MCVKFPSKDLNPDPFLPHPTNIYIYKVTIVPKLRNSKNISIFLKKKKHTQLLKIRTSLLLHAIMQIVNRNN